MMAGVRHQIISETTGAGPRRVPAPPPLRYARGQTGVTSNTTLDAGPNLTDPLCIGNDVEVLNVSDSRRSALRRLVQTRGQTIACRARTGKAPAMNGFNGGKRTFDIPHCYIAVAADALRARSAVASGGRKSAKVLPAVSAESSTLSNAAVPAMVGPNPAHIPCP